jgi:hypothetical protein
MGTERSVSRDPRFKVAHINEQGQNIIIIPLDNYFGSKISSDQQAIIAEFQMRSKGAGLAGTVVPVWLSGGRMSFIAPPQWHSYFGGLNWNNIQGRVNKEIYW